MDIYDEIRAERDRQDEKWGGPALDDEQRIGRIGAENEHTVLDSNVISDEKEEAE